MRSLTSAALIFLLSTPLFAQEGQAIYKLIPEDTVAMAVFPNLSHSKASIKGSNLCKLVEDSQLEAFFKKLLKSAEAPMKEFTKQAEQTLGVPLDKALGLFKGELGVAVIKIDPDAGMPEVLLSLQFGDQRATLDLLLAQLVKVTGAEPKVEDHNKHKVTTLAGEGGPPLIYTILGDRIYFTIGNKATLTGALDRADKGGGASLGTSKRFAKVTEAMGVGEGVKPNFGLYLNVELLWKLLEGQAPPEVSKGLAQFGISDWTAIAYTNRIEDGQFVDCLHVATKAAPRGPLKWLTPRVVTNAHLERMPKKAMAMSVAGIDFAGTYAELLAAIKGTDEGAFGQLSEMIAQVEKEVGVNFKTFLATFGDVAISHSTAPEVGFFPRSITEVKLADAKGFVAQMQALAKGTGMELATSTYKGKTIYQLRSPLGEFGQNPFDQMDREPDSPAEFFNLMMRFVTMHWTIDGDWLVMGSMHQHVLDHLDVPAEAKGVEHKLPEGTTAMTLANATRVMAGIYDTMLPFVCAFEPWLRMAGVDWDSRLLPRTSKILQHLNNPTMYHVRRTDSGMTFTIKGDITVLPIFGAAAGAGAGAALILGRSSGGEFDAPMPPMKEEMPRDVPAEKKIAVGKVAPAFTLKDAAGNEVALAKLKGKVVVIDFWATWCGPCKQVMPGLQALSVKYKDKPVAVYGVNVWEDDATKAPAYMKKQGLTYGLLLNGDKVADQYEVDGIPALFVIGADGKIAYVHVGADANTAALIEKAVAKALAAAGK